MTTPTAYLIDVTLRYPADAMGTGNPETIDVNRILTVARSLTEAVDDYVSDMTLAPGVPELIGVDLAAAADEYDYMLVEGKMAAPLSDEEKAAYA